MIVALILTACGANRQSIPVAPVAGSIPDGQARVVIARKGNLLIAQGRRMEVRRDGMTIGMLAPDGFLAWDQQPGSVNLDVEGTPLPLTLEAGKVTCVEMSVGFGGIEARFIDSGSYRQFITAYHGPKNEP